MLQLMYITNDVEVAEIVEEAGVDRIFIDLEKNGKEERQGHIDSVKSTHEIIDVERLRPHIRKAQLLVRVNPIYIGSEEEINQVIQYGADIIMLPMYKTLQEVKTFIKLVNGRARTMLLLETREAHIILEEVLRQPGIDEIHIGLNDLHLSYHKKFMFELLIDGVVEDICRKIKNTHIPYGFGGIAALGTGTLPAEEILCEHYRLGSQFVILGRSFCDMKKEHDLEQIRAKFQKGIQVFREYEKKLARFSADDYMANQILLKKHILTILNKM